MPCQPILAASPPRLPRRIAQDFRPRGSEQVGDGLCWFLVPLSVVLWSCSPFLRPYYLRDVSGHAVPPFLLFVFTVPHLSDNLDVVILLPQA